jgi:hypothetical protein
MNGMEGLKTHQVMESLILSRYNRSLKHVYFWHVQWTSANEQ